MACNRELGEGSPTMISPPDMNKTFTLSKANLNIINEDIEALYIDMQVLYGIAKALGQATQRGVEAMLTGNQIINTLVKGDWSDMVVKDSRELAKSYFGEANHRQQHVVHAMGHCHIDCAWLWPYSETIRKCARSWASTLDVMRRYPNFTFVCSQAQQLAWIKSDYPSLYQQIKVQVENGRFIPVGGAWVEMDGNLPSGESMMMHFFYGQKFFREEFGITCEEFWLPDTFGYSGNFPQIMKESGIRRFLTQKLSWNLVNKFPHHTFYWEGIDGSRQLTHFPPGESYGMEMQPDELMKTMKNHSDKGRSNSSMMLFGYGDGGGGPNNFMVERFNRMKNCAGLPRVEMSNPQRFFEEVETSSSNLCTWVGELFLELHNGTYTSQALIKKLNRQCEVKLHDLELLCTMAWCRGRVDGGFRYAYPQDDIDRLWKLVLLNQFHDVLPGSCIEMVIDDAVQLYNKVIGTATRLTTTAMEALGVGGGSCDVIINTLPWKRREVVDIDGKQKFVECNSCGYGGINEVDTPSPVYYIEDGEKRVVIGNGVVRCSVDSMGRIGSIRLHDKDGNIDEEEFVADGRVANQFVVFDDVPLYWDAWDVMDYHLETGKYAAEVVEPLHLVEQSKLRVSCKYSVKICSSLIEQVISLEAGSPLIKCSTHVTWRESHKFLKVEFPLNIRSNHATYEIQFGHIDRPTHQNTSWDSAKYEVWGHKWADLSQHNKGVAVLNDCKYGYSCFGNVMQLSLLRSPKAPDGNADMGKHEFTYAIMPHRGTFQQSGVIKHGYQLNYPLLPSHATSPTPAFTFVEVSTEQVILETCRKSHMHKNAIVLRLYESYGGSAQDVNVTFPHNKVVKVQRCNTLEDIQHDVTSTSNSFSACFTPFQIQSFIVYLQ